MFKQALMSTAALALLVGAADARPNVTLSNNNRNVSVVPVVSLDTRGGALKGQNDVLAGYSTLAHKYPNGLYFCCYGNTVSGPSSFFGAAYGVAEQFTPKANDVVTLIKAAVGYVSGDDTVTLTLYADNGSNEPGAVLASASGTTATEFGLCCGTVNVSIPATILNVGQNYWVGITTTGANFEAAPFETVDEVNANYVAGTSDGGTTWGTSYQTTTRPAISLK